MKVTKHTKQPIKEIVPDVQSDLDELKTYLNEILVDRGIAVKAIILAMLTEQHVMLEGPPGVAKSMLAATVFKSIDGARIFEKQLMKGTKPEELFGPLDLKKYQTESIWQHNTAGKLPDAHFAFLDEVYRASDMLLPSCLGILNERKFENGTEIVRCPLITAVGTTNFTTENEELAAFHDRWLLWVKIAPVTVVNSRIRMLNGFLDRLTADMGRRTYLRLSNLKYAIKKVRAIEVPNEVLSAYANLCSTLSQRLSTPISDRRFCNALRLAQASAYLRGLDTVDEDALNDTMFGLVTHDNGKQVELFTNAFSHVIGAMQRFRTEEKDILRMEEMTSTVLGYLSDDMSETRMRKLLNKSSEMYNIISSSEELGSQELTERRDASKAKLDGLMLELRTRLGEINPASNTASSLKDIIDEPDDSP